MKCTAVKSDSSCFVARWESKYKVILARGEKKKSGAGRIKSRAALVLTAIYPSSHAEIRSHKQAVDTRDDAQQGLRATKTLDSLWQLIQV